MINDWKFFEEWEKEQRRKEPVNLLQNLRLLEAMHEEARSLKIFPLKNPLEGLDAKIQWVKALHLLKASRSKFFSSHSILNRVIYVPSFIL